MIKHIFTFFVIIIMTGAFIAGCGESTDQKVDNAKEKLGEAAQELKDVQTEYLAEWQTFKSESEQIFAANQKRIDAFKESLEKAGPEVKAKYSDDVAALEQKNLDLKNRLNEYKEDGKSDWKEFMTSIKTDMDGIENSMKEFSQNIVLLK
jgi:hypothetical protein